MPITDTLKDEGEHRQVMEFLENHIKMIAQNLRPIELAVTLALAIFAHFNSDLFEELIKIYKAPDRTSAIYYLRDLWTTLKRLIQIDKPPPDTVLIHSTREEMILTVSKKIIKQIEPQAVRLLEAVEHGHDHEQAEYYLALACLKCNIEPQDLQRVVTFTQ